MYARSDPKARSRIAGCALAAFSRAETLTPRAGSLAIGLIRLLEQAAHFAVVFARCKVPNKLARW